MKETAVWGIHAGRTSEAENLFFKKNVIAIGWEQMGDLSKIKPNREAFRNAAVEAYPDKKPGAIPNLAGQPFRFLHEMKINDIVIYPSKMNRKVYIGKIVGDYIYNLSFEKSYPHRRTVKWIKSFPRAHFTQKALYEIGSAISLFQVKNYAYEFLDALEGKQSQKAFGSGLPI